MRERLDLFVVSILVLFLELACIRWFPAHVLFLSFFTNTVLLASFLGMWVGCLAANRRRDFLGMSRVLPVGASCLLAFAPILFAGVVFGGSFSNARDPERAFGANIAGAMFGGLSENSSMLLGFQYAVLLTVAFHVCSAISARYAARRAA